ncbi:MAG TPA: cation diffusion facilitator family transporter [Gemmatimonadales bacterium]|nr:cation diffusion facilitator family transporter [Gemmatimonadales bacterium]
MSGDVAGGIRMAQRGLILNIALALTKGIAGILGNSYALIADAIESTADIFGSLIVWGGLRISSRTADEDYPFGYGKAEALAAMVVGVMLAGAAVGISVEAVKEIVTPHHAPAPFTLVVLVVVVIVKELFFRRVARVARESGSTAVEADAWHHRSDAITSAAAFVGIGTALLGGPGWESADDWAALVASGVILWNGVGVLRSAAHDLMDRTPDGGLLDRIEVAARAVEGVLATEKLMARKVGTRYYVDLHVQAEPGLSLQDAHILSGKVKTAIRRDVPEVAGALIHMEPYEGERPGVRRAGPRG